MTSRSIRAVVAAAAVLLLSSCSERPVRSVPREGYTGWETYGGGNDQIRYSRLTQINRENVKDLTVAWTYDTGDAFPGSEMQCNPSDQVR